MGSRSKEESLFLQEKLISATSLMSLGQLEPLARSTSSGGTIYHRKSFDHSGVAGGLPYSGLNVHQWRDRRRVVYTQEVPHRWISK